MLEGEVLYVASHEKNLGIMLLKINLNFISVLATSVSAKANIIVGIVRS